MSSNILHIMFPEPDVKMNGRFVLYDLYTIGYFRNNQETVLSFPADGSVKMYRQEDWAPIELSQQHFGLLFDHVRAITSEEDLALLAPQLEDCLERLLNVTAYQNQDA